MYNGWSGANMKWGVAYSEILLTFVLIWFDWMDPKLELATARMQIAAREIVLWTTPSEPPKALQASECSELLDPMRASCLILAQHQPGKFKHQWQVSFCQIWRWFNNLPWNGHTAGIARPNPRSQQRQPWAQRPPCFRALKTLQPVSGQLCKSASK